MELLNQTAINKMNELMENGELNNSEEYKKASDELWSLLEKVEKTMGYNTVFNLEGACIEHSRVYGEENFIRGFLEGVKFISTLKNELNCIKKEQSAATDRSHVQIS